MENENTRSNFKCEFTFVNITLLTNAINPCHVEALIEFEDLNWIQVVQNRNIS
jgi:hypothetical protein